MQNYIDIQEEKKKAFKKIFKKYSKMIFLTFLGAIFGFSDILLFFLEPIFPLIVPELKFVSFFAGFGIMCGSITVMLKYFMKDFTLLFPLLRDEFKIEKDVVEYIRYNDIRYASDKDLAKNLKRVRIYFKNTNKTYEVVDNTEFKKGDNVFIWLNTNFLEVERIIYVTKIEK